ncbi:MAG: hypothetical protein GXP54_01535 [Deltaproteobacteria bacterium]|nr:hypothetical protein [Deltaproteobacteria bacterium]
MPERLSLYGSPTILVDGKDVAAAETADTNTCCRVYVGEDGGFQGVPSIERISEALSASVRQGGSVADASGTGRKGTLAVLPGLALAFLPKAACPACWPAYAGLLGALGLGFLMDAAYLLPLTAGFLVLAVGAMVFRAGRRRGYGPAMLGLAASGVVLVGKFVLDSDTAMYAGIGLLVAASIWNTWPIRQGAGPACVECASLSKGR